MITLKCVFGKNQRYNIILSPLLITSEKVKQSEHQESRRQKIIKVRVEINEIENTHTIKRINKPKFVLQNTNKSDIFLSRLQVNIKDEKRAHDNKEAENIKIIKILRAILC